jgi:nucleoside permease NupC
MPTRRWERVISFAGLGIFILLSWIFSEERSKIDWYSILLGLWFQGNADGTGLMSRNSDGILAQSTMGIPIRLLAK